MLAIVELTGYVALSVGNTQFFPFRTDQERPSLRGRPPLVLRQRGYRPQRRVHENYGTRGTFPVPRIAIHVLLSRLLGHLKSLRSLRLMFQQSPPHPSKRLVRILVPYRFLGPPRASGVCVHRTAVLFGEATPHNCHTEGSQKQNHWSLSKSLTSHSGWYSLNYGWR